jgi:hypothetical protein
LVLTGRGKGVLTYGVLTYGADRAREGCVDIWCVDIWCWQGADRVSVHMVC